jgi:hypothetical protein
MQFKEDKRNGASNTLGGIVSAVSRGLTQKCAICVGPMFMKEAHCAFLT